MKTRPAGLPDERVWIKYSPHNELPISVSSSLFIHVVVLGVIGLILAGFLGRLFGPHDKTPDVLLFDMPGGGGGPLDGAGDNPALGARPTGSEVIQKNNPQEAVPPIESKELPTPTNDSPPVVSTEDFSNRILPEMNVLSNQRLSNVAKEADRKIAAAIAGKGLGGPGSDGGMGKGKGKGIGDNVGDGSGNNATVQQKRRIRWTITFSTLGGRDYLRQLAALGAFMAVPTEDNQLMVYRDLNRTPAVGKREDPASIPNLRFYDDKPESVRDLSRELGLAKTPQYLFGYFPQEFEQELRRLELAAYKGDEDNIEETIFQVVPRGKKCEAKLLRVRLKR